MRATEAPTSDALLIVGAGVAGLSLAIALGRAGIRVTVIDGASRPQTPADGRDINDWDLRVSALTPASVAFLDDPGRLVADTRESESLLHGYAGLGCSG